MIAINQCFFWLTRKIVTVLEEKNMENLPEKLCILYQLYKEGAAFSQKRGFSSEEAFWIQFAQICPSIVWDDNSPTEVKLSEIFRLYLSLYFEQINPQMTVDEEPTFLELLKERYDKVNWIIFESHPNDYGLATLDLGRLILGEGADIIRLTQVGMGIVGVACVMSEHIPLKLVRDV